MVSPKRPDRRLPSPILTMIDHAHPPHGVAKRPERYRPAPVCRTQANPQTTVSPERPICAAAPFRPNGWYRRSVPTVGNPTLRGTTAPHTHRMVSQSVPSGSDLHPCAKRCLLTDHGIAGASHLCRDRTSEELTDIVRRRACPSSSEVVAVVVREKACPSPSEVQTSSVRRRAYPSSSGELLDNVRRKGEVRILPPPKNTATMLMYTPRM